MSNKSSRLYLFTQIPIGAKFTFEKPNEGKIFTKWNTDGAHHEFNYQKVNGGVLVFLVQDQENK